MSRRKGHKSAACSNKGKFFRCHQAGLIARYGPNPVEEGETSSAYFFCLERKRGADMWISALRDSDSSIVSSSSALCCTFAFLYFSLIFFLLLQVTSWFRRSSWIIFFSWSGKRDLVSCSRVVQSPLFGGFLVVDVNLKVWSLLSQWIERFASSPSGWVSLMSHWFESLFNASPVTVVSRPYSFDPGVLSPFFKSLLFVYSSLSPMCALRFPACPPNSDNCFSSLSI